ncbi:MAG TPA: heparan-alpha-glucosaminide N-acetyltransferase domain-containing protein [Vicinamibacterales bacterium]|nr:heparan-alpha-glucosaminide N-acetyltransferase domain-containing protein [Vicinamibacterales bacterium]
MKSAHRRAYIDWARGLAVLLMIEAHTTDAWTRAAAKSSIAFRNLAILGGFAAPAFLWLAGLAAVLSAARTERRTGSREVATEALCRRGLEIFILAFLFRLQAFIVSPGSHPVTLFRVDILNIIGPAVVAVALIRGLGGGVVRRVWLYAAAAATIAVVTPLIRSSEAVDLLPTWLQWYVRPAGEHTTFTLFPWIGFAFAGAAVGELLASANGDDVSERRLHALATVVALGLIASGVYFASKPSIYRAAGFWTSSPTWFMIRTGLVTLALPALYACANLLRSPALEAMLMPLARLGQRSLFVYWIHVELVYGYTTWWLRGRLPVWGTLVAFAVFCAAMYGTVLARDRVVEAWRLRRLEFNPAGA